MTSAPTRAVLVLLAIALNGWPWFERGGDRHSEFIPPASASSSTESPFLREEFINPESRQPMSHVASICELPDGALAVAWYAGSREGAGDVAIYLSSRQATDAAWSSPRPIVTRESASRDLNRYVKKVGNPLLFADTSGTLWLVYVTVAVGGWSGSSLNVAISADRGATWTVGQRLTLSPFFNVAELVKNAPVPLDDRGWAVPMYHELVSTFAEVLWLHETNGEIVATKSRMSAGWFGYQPALTQLSAGRALAILRDDGATRALSIARTEDAGRSWSQPEGLTLPNPDSGLDGIRLQDGRLLLAFNDSTTGRENLRLAMSSDEGRTWTRIATLAEEAGADFSYPFLMQTRNGDVHAVYTWHRKAIKHVVFNVAWLDQRRRDASR